MARQKPEKEPAKGRPCESEMRVDEQIEESFPASDPPAFAGGSHAVGEPRRPGKPSKAP